MRLLKLLLLVYAVCVAALIGGGIGATEVDDHYCLDFPCKWLNQTSSPFCPMSSDCDFANAGGSVIFCTYFPDDKCPLVMPVASSECTGLCVMDKTLTCKVGYAKCKL